MNKKHLSSTGTIRIIGGQWRGRKLPVISNLNLRPTTDRMRETLFNWLAPVIKGTHCLDCFAGSGALGIEALSRNAASVTLLEKNSTVSAQIFKTLQVLQVQEQAQLINTNSLKWLNSPGETYDLIFIDPPFRQGMIDQTIKLIELHHRLAPKGWVYIEMEIKITAISIPTYWQLYREKIAGQVIYRLYVCNNNKID